LKKLEIGNWLFLLDVSDFMWYFGLIAVCCQATTTACPISFYKATVLPGQKTV